MRDSVSPKTLTLLAFIVGFTLIDELSSTEQNSLGNWFMLVGQTLCTNGSEHFRRDYRDQVLNKNTTDYINLMNKAKNAIDKGINKIQ